MNSKGQAGLEYLMTYGWALILIVSVAGILFFVLSPPTSSITFRVDTTNFLMRSNNVVPGTTDALSTYTVEIQNASGRAMTITGLTPTGLSYVTTPSGCVPDCTTPISLPSGGILKITGNMTGYSTANTGSIAIDYSTAGYTRTANIQASGKIPGVTGGGSSTCPNGVCLAGEICPADASGCAHQLCKTVACTNGCVYANIADTGTDPGFCAPPSTGCTPNPSEACACNGLGACTSHAP